MRGSPPGSTCTPGRSRTRSWRERSGSRPGRPPELVLPYAAPPCGGARARPHKGRWLGLPGVATLAALILITAEVPVTKMALPAVMLALVTGAAFAEPVTYPIDPAHTFPSFEADHL